MFKNIVPYYIFNCSKVTYCVTIGEVLNKKSQINKPITLFNGGGEQLGKIKIKGLLAEEFELLEHSQKAGQDHEIGGGKPGTGRDKRKCAWSVCYIAALPQK